LKLPIHFEIILQILPAITFADIADRAPLEIGRGAERHMAALAFDVEQRTALDVVPPRRIVQAQTFHMGSEQGKHADLLTQALIRNFQARGHEEDRRVGIGDDVFDQPVSSVGAELMS